jgi:hypothetical protein
MRVTRIAVVVAAGALAACVVEEEPKPRLPPLPVLAQDQGEPVLALFEHVLTGYFAGAGPNAPTTCAALRSGPLSAAQEQELIARFVRLAPAARCRAGAGGTVDALTGGPAVLVELADFACAQAACAGTVRLPGRPAARYALRFESGAWRFDGDAGVVAE